MKMKGGTGIPFTAGMAYLRNRDMKNFGPVRLRWDHFVFPYKRPFPSVVKWQKRNERLVTVKGINLPFSKWP